MKRNKPSMDGFVARRSARVDLNHASMRESTTVGRPQAHNQVDREHISDDSELHIRQSDGDLQQTISQSLQAIDHDAAKGRQKKRKNKKKRRIGKIIGLVVGAAIIAVVGFVAYKALMATGRVFQGGIFDIFQQQQLKKDSYGRSNVLILGSTDDMPGRDGANLTDSMMVLSVDQDKKDAYMFSIPRDLYVQYDRACLPGYAGKINAYFMCADSGDSQEAELNRMNATRDLVGKIFDMDIQYVVHVNTIVIRDAVNAVGGITVNVESSDPRGVLDSTFDDKCIKNRSLCPRGHYMSFPNGPNQMDGDQAMAFSQSRGNTAPTYGLEMSNFDREKNQQLVLMALKDKAASSGTLTDLGKVTALMDAMGNNLRTNIETKEIQSIMSLASDIKPENIHRLSFVEEDNVLMGTGMVGAESVVQPRAGLYQYGAIRAFLKKNIYATEVSKENAKVAVLNGSGISGRAQQTADSLEELGMSIASVGNAPQQITVSYEIYKLAGDNQKTATAAKLKELYGVDAISGAPDFSLAVEGADFVVIVGPKSE